MATTAAATAGSAARASATTRPRACAGTTAAAADARGHAGATADANPITRADVHARTAARADMHASGRTAHPGTRTDAAAPELMTAIVAAEPEIEPGRACIKAGAGDVEGHPAAQYRIEVFAVADVVDIADAIGGRAQRAGAGERGGL
jgi:hypothetical protein